MENLRDAVIVYTLVFSHPLIKFGGPLAGQQKRKEEKRKERKID